MRIKVSAIIGGVYFTKVCGSPSEAYEALFAIIKNSQGESREKLDEALLKIADMVKGSTIAFETYRYKIERIKEQDDEE